MLTHFLEKKFSWLKHHHVIKMSYPPKSAIYSWYKYVHFPFQNENSIYSLVSTTENMEMTQRYHLPKSHEMEGELIKLAGK